MNQTNNKYDGPFYVVKGVNYVLSDICKECAFCDEDGQWCCMSPCIHFANYNITDPVEAITHIKSLKEREHHA